MTVKVGSVHTCNEEFIKHVLPRFLSPQSPGAPAFSLLLEKKLDDEREPLE